MNWITERSTAILAGSAIGDALGGPTEGWTPEAIQERWGGPVMGIVPPFHENWATARPLGPYHKGDGHITDDTLMTQALVQVYAARRTHLDAYNVAEDLVPILISEPRWIPELERETILLQRIFLAEKWIVTRVHYGHIDPRDAGVGNIVNCGAAMYMAPVGVVNAGNPEGAYGEALELSAPHQSSYGREAAAVFAAAVAVSATPGATATDVLETAIAMAHDGTKAALVAQRDAVASLPRDADLATVRLALRQAILPFDTVGETYREPAPDARIASRTKAIEELPVALGYVAFHDGHFTDAVLGGVNYGRDSDSIASMAGAICGGLRGMGSVTDPTSATHEELGRVRADWLSAIEQASRIDVRATAATLADVACEVQAADAARATARLAMIESVVGVTV